MPRSAVDTSMAIARLLRNRREKLGLTLRDVEQQTSGAGRLIPFSTLAKIEQGKLDPGIKRLHLLLKLYNLPIQMAGDLLDLEELADVRPKGRNLESLYKEGLEAWRKGETRKGLAYLFTLRELVPDDEASRHLRHKALHAFAVLVSSLGKYRLALRIVEDLLVEDLDQDLRVQVMLQAARVWNAIGSPDAALAFLGRAESYTPPEDHTIRAWIHHGRAGAYDSLGIVAEARVEVDRAIEEYRKAEDLYGEIRAYGMLVRVLRSARDYSGALKAAETGTRLAEERGHARTRILRMIDKGQVLLDLEETEAGIEALNESLAAAISGGEHGAQFYCHYYLWKARTATGDEERAALDLRSACYYVRYVDESTKETIEIGKFLDRKEEAR